MKGKRETVVARKEDSGKLRVQGEQLGNQSIMGGRRSRSETGGTV